MVPDSVWTWHAVRKGKIDALGRCYGLAEVTWKNDCQAIKLRPKSLFNVCEDISRLVWSALVTLLLQVTVVGIQQSGITLTGNDVDWKILRNHGDPEICSPTKWHSDLQHPVNWRTQKAKKTFLNYHMLLSWTHFYLFGWNIPTCQDNNQGHNMSILLSDLCGMVLKVKKVAGCLEHSRAFKNRHRQAAWGLQLCQLHWNARNVVSMIAICWDQEKIIYWAPC